MPKVYVGLYVGVVGPGDEASDRDCASARDVGRLLAERDALVVCGGLGGVMSAVCEGARAAGGVTVGLLPGLDRADGNPHLTVALPTGLGELRNALLVRSVDVLISVAGSWGTLSEVALARRAGVPVVGVRPWRVEGEPVAEECASPADAVHRALTLASR